MSNRQVLATVVVLLVIVGATGAWSVSRVLSGASDQADHEWALRRVAPGRGRADPLLLRMLGP